MHDLFAAIPALLEQLQENEIAVQALVFAAWRRTAGDLLRERTIPLSFGNKRLAIGVEDDTWKLHLESLSKEMLYKLNTALGHGTIAFIEFRTRPEMLAEQRSVTGKRSQTAQTVQIDKRVLRAAETIADEGLRQNFLSAASAYLSRG